MQQSFITKLPTDGDTVLEEMKTNSIFIRLIDWNIFIAQSLQNPHILYPIQTITPAKIQIMLTVL
jgi:hypothetical protein